ncbi:MAG: DUF2703 domain-containing protein [Tissierellia bacterium]|nr:DUF2703 domain-containing protein [Tissierellia bacterium]
MHYSISAETFEEVKRIFEDFCDCSCSDACCSSKSIPSINKREVVIDLLYLDISVCERCQGADRSLDEAVNDVANILKETGIEVKVNKINVLNEELAVKHRFLTSPTIRINGKDIQMDYKENLCESCGDLCGDEVDCRVWIYRGKEYAKPPKAMIIEAILKEVYGVSSENLEQKEYQVPENLRKFYQSMKSKN